MIIVIINKYAHRLMSNGEWQSASCVKKENGDIKIRNDWAKRLPEDVNLTGGEFSIIHDYLLRMQQIQFATVEPLPKAEPLNTGIVLDQPPEPI